ncbi:sensor histidine kinase [Winogradskyella sediminis]|uniref:sensor histidine kinase n=1 Tax=Winogradskyella sediminis TaxID=1382466 RepID=UPI003AA9B5D3
MLQARDQIVTSDAQRYLLVYMVGVLVVICALIIIFFIIFQKRKNQLLIDKVKQQQKFDEELIKTQQEIQEETLKHVGRELHDNIGQMLVMSTMQMNTVLTAVSSEAKIKVNSAADTLKSTLEEVRALSRTLNSDVILNLGFEATLKNEIARLNKSSLIKAILSISGKKVSFENKKDEIILFRILQEFFSNTLKHAEAEHIHVSLDYWEDHLDIKVEDDGVGFHLDKAEKGSGLINIEKRVELLKGTFQLNSKVDKGTVLTLKYPYKMD